MTVKTRPQLLTELLEELTPAAVRDTDPDRKFSAAALLVCDVMLSHDSESLGEMRELLRNAHGEYARMEARARHGESEPLNERQWEAKGRLLGLHDLCFDAAERVWPSPQQAGVEDGSVRKALLRAVAEAGMRGAGLEQLYEMAEADVDTVRKELRTLMGFGMVVCRRFGRIASYEITPKGEMVLARSEGRLTV